jgi:hypothetical protein
MITNEMLSQLRANVTELATTIGCGAEAAFDASALPAWIWDEVVAAQDAAGPAPEFSFNLLASQSPERAAAATKVLANVRAFVCS